MASLWTKFTDIFSREKNGVVPKAPLGSGKKKFLREDGTWSEPDIGDCTLADLRDVSINGTPLDNDVLVYDTNKGKWVNSNSAGGSSDRSYSAQEKLIGKWIDGTNVYERTYRYTTSNSEDIIPDSIVDGEIISMVGSLAASSTLYKSLPHYVSDSNFVRCFYRKSSGINLRTSEIGEVVWVVTIRYHRRPWREITPEEVGFTVTEQCDILIQSGDDFVELKTYSSSRNLGNENITYFTATKTYQDTASIGEDEIMLLNGNSLSPCADTIVIDFVGTLTDKQYANSYSSDTSIIDFIGDASDVELVINE